MIAYDILIINDSYHYFNDSYHYFVVEKIMIFLENIIKNIIKNLIILLVKYH